MRIGPHKYEGYYWLADEAGEFTYAVEHRFLERPDVETVKALFEEAKDHFAVVYDDESAPEDFIVRVTCLEADSE